MYQLLITFDHEVFLFINHLPHTPVSDVIALTLSGVLVSTVIVWLLLSVWLFVREQKRDHWFFLPVVLASTLSILVTDVILKNFFSRNRPPPSLGTINIGGPLADYSFPSGHATFAWALAIVLANKEPRAKWLFYLLAFLISLSRIYLGKHYPSDVIAGSLVGLGIGYMSLWTGQNMIKYVYAKVKRQRASHHRSGSGSRQRD
jgi:undecaprenyl-diphosphatase